MEGISKSFPGVCALDNAQFHLKPGTVHALVGENGAGKSTLMKILIGVYRPDKGKITLKGKDITINNANVALGMGITMIHQELMPVLDMKVYENIYLGREPTGKIFHLVDDRTMIRNCKQLFGELDIEDIPPTAKMRDLPIAWMQMVEIAKAYSYNSDLIIMDEPTSTISEKEVEKLFRMIRKLRSRNIGIIYISHRIDEIFEICDEITVFRDGKFIDTDLVKNMNRNRLYSLMVARDLSRYFAKTEHKLGDVIFEVKNLCLENKFHDVSFSLRRGEILGLCGLIGAGRTEIVETIFGIRKATSGKILYKGKELQIKSVRDAMANGIALATEDRKYYGLFLELDIKQNITICYLDHISKHPFLKPKKEIELSSTISKTLNVKTPSMTQLVRNLSGGNQQKVVLAKWLLSDPDILILDEPTRGIDVGAKSEIYSIMDNLTKQGKSIVMISSEMPEVIGMSDRILVVRKGQISAELDNQGQSVTQEDIIRYAAN
ncbi:MAG: sugar ABC transporter ATP-binding protein [Treponema sp.]|nr:sugar ABC transporter ATP-binding protein [Treponema sp.]